MEENLEKEKSREIEIDLKSSDSEPDKTGKEKDDKEGPPEGSKRWKEIYWKAKEGERAIAEREALRLELKHSRELIKEMSEHNKKLAEVLEDLSINNKRSAMDNEINKIEDKINELRALRKSAREKADYETEDKIEEEIIDLKLKLRELKNKPVSQISKDKEKESIAKKTASSTKNEEEIYLTEEEKEIYAKWLNENAWIYENPKVRSAAVEAEKTIRTDPDFAMATEEEILDEIKRRLEEKFKPPTGKVDMFHSGDKGKSTNLDTANAKVKLSDIELTLAEGFGIDPKEVAKQKLAIMNFKGRRTYGT